jgi:uncharacterized membrane protein YbhN (UPF0104 family)
MTDGQPMPPYVRWIGLAFGVVLVVAAVVTVVTQHEKVSTALAAIRHPDPIDVVVLFGTVLANIVLTGLMFSVLMSRHGRVGLVEMQALIAAAGLANYLPLRPGLFGRAAYHKAFNDIALGATVKVTLLALAISVAIASYLACCLFIAGRVSIPLWVFVGGAIPVLATVAAVPASRRIGVAALIRYVEVLLLAVRYQAAFALIGSPIDFAAALTVSCVALVVTLIPLTGNGLGLREWAVGIAAGLLTPYVLELGLAADLVNRAAEALFVAVLGLSAFAWLAARRRTGTDPFTGRR